MDDVMDEDDDPMQFVNTAFINNQELDMMSQPYDSSNKEHVDEEMDILREHEHPRSECKKSLFVQPLQDTPPDAASNQHEQPLLSPSTLGLAIKGAMKGSSQPLPQKKPRKRPNRKDLSAKKVVNASSSKSVPPTGFADRVPMKGTALIHVAGEPILPSKPVESISGELRRLHDHVLSTEKSLLASKDPGYPLYAVHVPPSMGYVDTSPAEVFFLPFEHIFEMFLTRRLDFTIVRLFALHMSFVIKREEISQIAVADPYYMHESFLSFGDYELKIAREYIENFMLMNKEKEMVLVPYHPM